MDAMPRMPHEDREFVTHPAIDRARRLSARAMSAWAMDLMWLRRSGLDRASARAGADDAVQPMRSMTSARAEFAPARRPKWVGTRRAA